MQNWYSHNWTPDELQQNWKASLIYGKSGRYDIWVVWQIRVQIFSIQLVQFACPTSVLLGEECIETKKIHFTHISAYVDYANMDSTCLQLLKVIIWDTEQQESVVCVVSLT